MKSVTKREALDDFEALGLLAHGGETVTVVHAGKPWIKLVPAGPRRGKSAAQLRARLDRISRKPIAGAADVLRRLRQ